MTGPGYGHLAVCIVFLATHLEQSGVALAQRPDSV